MNAEKRIAVATLLGDDALEASAQCSGAASRLLIDAALAILMSSVPPEQLRDRAAGYGRYITQQIGRYVDERGAA